MVPQEDFHHLSLNDQVLGSLEPGSLGASQLLQLMRLTRIFFYLPTTPHVVSAGVSRSAGPSFSYNGLIKEGSQKEIRGSPKTLPRLNFPNSSGGKQKQ